MPKLQDVKYAIGPGLVFFVICLLAVFFRTYGLHDGPLIFLRSPKAIAEVVVDHMMGEQVKKELVSTLKKIPPSDRKVLIETKVDRLKREAPGQYAATVQSAAKNIERSRREKKPVKYLLEADPYHYFYQAERLVEEGNTGDISRAGKIHQPLGRAPFGSWEPFGLHPHAGVVFFRLLRLCFSQVTLIEALAWFPVFLTCLIILVFLIFSKILGLEFWGGAAGALTIILSPVYIQRSSFGWFDTDPYHYFFPLSVLSLIFWGLGNGKKYLPMAAVLAGILTVFYYYFWNGWSFLLILSAGCLAASGILLSILRRQASSDIGRESFRFLGIYLGSALLFLCVFLTPQGLWESVCGAWAALNQFFLAKFDLWPNVFLTVGEAGGISLMKMIFLVGNPVTFAIAMLGLVSEVWGSFREDDPRRRFRAIFFIFFSIPLFFISLKTERFTVLAVLPTAIFVGFALSNMLSFGERILEKIKNGFVGKLFFSRTVLIGLFSLVFLPMPLLMAHIVATGVQPIMDDVWHEALTEIRNKTPEDAIIDTWWPPGHFVIAVSHRRVIMDGGTQNFHQTYWMAKVLFSEDEKESAGLLRMLNTSGDSAFEFLEKMGMDTPDAVGLILNIVRVDRDKAFTKLPATMTERQKDKLLEKTHGFGNVPPTYVLLYDDLIAQNLAASTMAQWDFRKAGALRKQSKKGIEGILDFFRENASTRYIQELVQVTGEFLKYQPASPLAKRRGDILIFGNGVIVNWGVKDSVLAFPEKGLKGRPISLFYIDQGKLVEKTFEGERLDASVLLFEQGGILYSVIADPKLIRSMLFRLYYLNGQGLTLFRPLIRKGSFSGGTVVQVFEMDRSKLAG